MKSAAAWNVKGVGMDARETAREAARRAGLSVGEWLNSVIIDTAGDAAQAPYADDRDAQSLSAIRQQLEALTGRAGNTPAPAGARDRQRAAGPAASDLRGLENRLSDLTRNFARRSEENPQRIAEAI